MRRWWLGLVTAWLAACGGSPTRAPVTSGNESSPAAGLTPVAQADLPMPFVSVVSPDQATGDVGEADGPVPPKGVVCTVRGSGRPAPSNCSSDDVLVSAGRNGSRPLARVKPEQVSLTWGFFRSRDSAWLHADDGAASVTGFASFGGETFTIRNEVPVMPDHVWLLEASPVKVSRGLEDGVVEVKVDGDLVDGVGAVSWKLSCDELGFDPQPRRVTSLNRGRTIGVRTAIAKTAKLRLRAQPAEEPFMTLSTTGERLYLSFEVVSEMGEFTRVRFRTSHAKFDVWVESNALQHNGLVGGMGRMVGACRMSHGPGTTERAVLAEDTGVMIGRASHRFTAPVRLAAGAEVNVLKREGGFASVVPVGRITPSDGVAFFVPESVLGR